jgi:hypothetical protein
MDSTRSHISMSVAMIDDKKRYHNCGHLHDDKVGDDSHFHNNMVVCIEFYTGGIGEQEGVKLE